MNNLTIRFLHPSFFVLIVWYFSHLFFVSLVLEHARTTWEVINTNHKINRQAKIQTSLALATTVAVKINRQAA